MKQVLLLFIIGLFFSCDSNEQNISESELIGNWQLIEVLTDSGNGKGTFKPVVSDKTIEFKNNGTVVTNRSLCYPYSEEQIDSGKFNLKTNRITTNCQNPNIAAIYFEPNYEFLILNFISNEGYSQKFQKIK